MLVSKKRLRKAEKTFSNMLFNTTLKHMIENKMMKN